MSMNKQMQFEFETMVKNRYPKLFARIVPLDFDIARQLTDDLIDAKSGYPTSCIRRMVARFIAQHTKSPIYILEVTKAFYKKQPRVGIYGPSTHILSGHILEMITIADREPNFFMDLENYEAMRYYEAVREELTCVVQ
ncbi:MULTISPECIES: hypothetical protein [Vibrio]|uniref:Uncharacterized protein n=2 Tax=Vibrio TaxID=662 RepID=A0A2N7ND17_9VIBR|nr:hypothetical protein [Vibrio tasmaniensis]PMO89824.1 hypothetical protein BCT01_00650 [Vibrio tasmaniensis]PMP10003.1 hypothetical protein BCS92_02440 [Vibrio tasmaniensis]TKG32612.1 hypothetical protein FC057_12410 [Vibrio tasmaniensis]TKG41704.1 hypothetical protein FC063_07530 [Vibrio tasmaniensis]TKG52059.1 hypothetical protein FC070_09800 [Vibrio tasmaniensis]